MVGVRLATAALDSSIWRLFTSIGPTHEFTELRLSLTLFAARLEFTLQEFLLTRSRFESLDFLCRTEANQSTHMASFRKFRTLRLSINTFSLLHSTNFGSGARQGMSSFSHRHPLLPWSLGCFLEMLWRDRPIPIRLRIIRSLGFSRGFRSHSALSSCEQKILKFEDCTTGAEAECDYEEVRKIRQEFDAAKRSFLKIPEALSAMPKLNPEGFFFIFSILLRFKVCILVVPDYFLFSLSLFRHLCE